MILLFTILCAGQIYGMEKEQPSGGPLVPDVYTEILKKVVERSNTLADAIQAVDIASVLQGIRYDNLKNFTRLVHILADKFHITTQEAAHKIASSLNNLLPIAKQYENLASNLNQALENFHSYTHPTKQEPLDARRNLIKRLIADGADVNYSSSLHSMPLETAAIHANDIQLIKLLLDAGARPDKIKFNFKKTSPSIANLLQKAMKKKQQ